MVLLCFFNRGLLWPIFFPFSLEPFSQGAVHRLKWQLSPFLKKKIKINMGKIYLLLWVSGRKRNYEINLDIHFPTLITTTLLGLQCQFHFRWAVNLNKNSHPIRKCGFGYVSPAKIQKNMYKQYRLFIKCAIILKRLQLFGYTYSIIKVWAGWPEL